MFNFESSINDILQDEFAAEYLDLVFPIQFLTFVPDEYKDLPLKELPESVKMPWGVPYVSDVVLDSVRRLYELKTDPRIICIPLWKERFDEDFFPKPQNNKESVCLFLYRDTFKEKRPVVIIVPGGAYSNVSIAGEGMDTADVLRQKGFAAAILNYRCCPNYYPAPQEDLALAIKYIRTNAEELQINADDITVLGYSAGGHLAASETLYAADMEKTVMNELKEGALSLYEQYKGISVKAEKLCLCYPFTGDDEARVCIDNLLGENQDLLSDIIVYKHVDSSWPKTFIWACKDDPLVDICNSANLYDSLKNNNVPCKMNLYPTGGHGIGVAKNTSAGNWMEEMISFLYSE